MKKLAIWGAGGTGIQIIEIAQWQNEEEHLWDEIFFVDNWKPEDEEIYGARNLHFDTVKELFLLIRLSLSLLSVNRVTESFDLRRYVKRAHKYVKRDKLVAKVLFQYFPKIQKLN